MNDETRARELLATASADCGCRIPSPFDEVALHAIELAFATPAPPLVDRGAVATLVRDKLWSAQTNGKSSEEFADYLADAILALSPSPADGRVEQAGVWRPIETAPKDGENLLLFSPDATEPGIMIGFWAEFHDPISGATETSWTDTWTGEEIDAWPTHWMPLPAGPSEAQATPPSGVSQEQRMREAHQVLRNGYADAVSGLEYIIREHGRLPGVGWDRVLDHYEKWVTIPEREGLLAGSHELAALNPQTGER